MSGNGHYVYFGQAIATGAEETENRNESGQTNPTGMTNDSSQSITVETVGGQGPMLEALGLRGQDPADTEMESPLSDGIFRANLVSWMDALVQDLKTEHQSQRPYTRSSKPYSKWGSMSLTSSQPSRNMAYTSTLSHPDKKGPSTKDYQHADCKIGKGVNLELSTLGGQLGNHVTMTPPWGKLNTSFSKFKGTYPIKGANEASPGP